MLRNKIYYRIKPLLPWPVRVGIRRLFAHRRRVLARESWPIMPGSEKPPANWAGWPDGKKFALVLTHDVESWPGVAKCHEVMELEQELGFRSCFSFVPQGDYTISRTLRRDLTRNGFEVGVHDLNHDGKLFHNRADFSEKAVRINRYLTDWGAVGFRSAFMLRNLDWLHELNIQYDSSTFDTDPFEPQPDGVGTIFPFWVPKPRSRNQPGIADYRSLIGDDSRASEGYVELPYTLPQDSTLFLLLGERTSDIWLQKLDWIARHGGMALVDVHPDYLSFDNHANQRVYPAAKYAELLDYLGERYKGQFWNVTPSELAKWYRETLVGQDAGSHKRFEGKKAAVLLYSEYKSDARPRREAEALVKSGMDVDVICLRQNPGDPTNECISGVNVRRVPLRHRRKGKLNYVLQYGFFISFCAGTLALRSLRKRYDLVHVHNMPDVLVFSGIFSKLRGARLLLDLHDPMPELMTTIFGFQEKSLPVSILMRTEKLSIWFADQVLTVNLACKRIFSSRSCKDEKIQVVMNCPDEEIFTFIPAGGSFIRQPDKPFVLMYHGSIVERHGLDLAIKALGLVRQSIPEAELRVYGSPTPFLELVRGSVEWKGMDGAIKYMGPKSLEKISEAILECDLGIIPNRRSIFTEINTPTRIFEYLSRGKPVIAPLAPGITDYFGPEDLFYFELGNAFELAQRIEQVYRNPSEVQEILERGQQIYLRHCWKSEKEAFLDTVDRLLSAEVYTNEVDLAERGVSQPPLKALEPQG
jgi:glycosyltransferase involved in cell wall biosynthesis